MGWELSCGELKKIDLSEDDFWILFNKFISKNTRKTSSYKFGLMKSILDNLLSVSKLPRGYLLTYEQIFSKFAENYWNLIIKYNIKQLRYNGKSEYSKLEQIYHDISESQNALEGLEFNLIDEKTRIKLIRKVIQGCKKNVLGAMYEDLRLLYMDSTMLKKAYG